MTLDEQISKFETDLTAGVTPLATLFQRGIFLVGYLDDTGATVNEVMEARGGGDERTFLMLGRLGELVGKDRDPDAVTMGPTTTTVEEVP